MNNIFTTLIDNVELYDSLESIENPVKKVSENTNLEVLEFNLGSKFEFTKVKYQNKEYYVKSCLLGGNSSKISQLFSDAGTYDDDPPPKELHIKDVQLNYPYKEGNYYNIVLETDLKSKEEIEHALLENTVDNPKYKAFLELLDYVGKDTSGISENEIKEFAFSPFKLLEVGDPYYPTRPGLKTRIKFSVHQKYFQIFEDMTFEKFAISNIHKNFIATNFKAKDLEKTLRKATKVLDMFNKKIKSFRGSVDGIDMSNLSKNMKRFNGDIRKYFLENGVDLSIAGDKKIEFGFNKETYRLEYVLYYDPYGKLLKIGMNKLCSIDSKISKTLLHLKDISLCGLNGIDWQDFLTKFYPREFKINFNSRSSYDNIDMPRNPKDRKDPVSLESIAPEDQTKPILNPDDNSRAIQFRDDIKNKIGLALPNFGEIVYDQIVWELPNFAFNIPDLDTLFKGVLQKIPIPELIDIVLGSFPDLTLPDFNEIKIRGVIKALGFEKVLPILEDLMIDIPSFQDFNLTLCDAYNFAPEEVEKLLSSITETQYPIEHYMLHYGENNKLSGLIAANYVGDLEGRLKELGIYDCIGLSLAIYNGDFDIKKFFQKDSFAKIICQIMSQGLPEYNVVNPCENMPEYLQVPKLNRINIGTLKFDLFDFFGGLNPSLFMNGVDIYFKKRFEQAKFSSDPSQEETTDTTANNPYSEETPASLFRLLVNIPQIKCKYNALQLTKKKLSYKIPGIDIDFEKRRNEVDFELPKVKDVNPSFDFTKFELGGIGDIFGDSILSIESTITKGIEKGLISTFTGLLNKIVESLNKDIPDLTFSDYGGLNINDLLDASNGTSSDIVIEKLLPKIKFNLSKARRNGCGIKIDLSEFEPTKEDVKQVFDDMSNSLKPMELTRVFSGSGNERDYGLLGDVIQSEEMKAILDKDFVKEIIDIISQNVEYAVIEELEKSYDDGKTFARACDDLGIPYKFQTDNKGRTKLEELKERYEGFSDEELDDLLQNIENEMKDSLVDAIGTLKDNFDELLPFDENPCSFMPNIADIPAMNFANNIIFDSIFDPIEQAYKMEASTVQDMFLVTAESDEYIKLYHEPFDSILTEPKLLDNGTYDLVFKTVQEVTGKEESVYNQEFSFHYSGEGMELYKLNDNGSYSEIDISLNKNDKDEWEINKDFELDNVYVKKSIPSLKPMPATAEMLTGFKRISTDGYYSPYIFTGDYVNTENNSLAIRTFSDKIKIVYENGIIKIVEEVYDTRSETYSCEPFAQDSESIKNGSVSIRDSRFIDIFINQISNTVTKYNSNKKPNKPYDNTDFSEYIETIRILDSTILKIGDGSFSVNLIPNLYRNFYSKILSIYGQTNFFNIEEVLSFIIDEEDIDLLKIKDAKNDAKDKYNSECSFAEGDRSLNDSAISKMIYLMIRVHVIEALMARAPLYNAGYDLEIDNIFFAYIVKNTLNFIKEQPNGFEALFMKKYKEAYNDTFSKDSLVLLKMVKEIFADISDVFSELFRSSDIFNKKLLDSFHYDLQKPKKENRWSLAREAIDEHGKFLIQRVHYNKIDGTEISPNENQTTGISDRATLRLCYVIESNDNFYPYVGAVGIGNVQQNIEVEALSDDSEGLGYQFYSLKNSLSYELTAFDEAVGYLLLPLAEIDVDNSDIPYGVSKEKLIELILENREIGGIYDFLENILGMQAMKTSVALAIKNKMLEEKPQFENIFIQTKEAIKLAINVLGRDLEDYGFQENETYKLMLDQMQNSSTNPSDSNGAAKMALQTIPMIIKGAAEMFDPNVKIASKIRTGASLSGLDIPPPVASLMALPMNLIPFAPGPPISPLGLLYLATSYLEPSERKKLSKLKRGKNLNPEANQETGTFQGGTFDELQAEAAVVSAERREEIQNKYNEIKDILIKFLIESKDQLTSLSHKDLSSDLDLANEWNSYPIKDIFDEKYWIKGAAGYVGGVKNSSIDYLDAGSYIDYIQESIDSDIVEAMNEEGTREWENIDLVSGVRHLADVFLNRVDDTKFIKQLFTYASEFGYMIGVTARWRLDRFLENEDFKSSRVTMKALLETYFVMLELMKLLIYSVNDVLKISQPASFDEIKYENYKGNFSSYASFVYQEIRDLTYVISPNYAEPQEKREIFVQKMDAAEAIADTIHMTASDTFRLVESIFGNQNSTNQTTILKRLENDYDLSN